MIEQYMKNISFRLLSVLLFVIACPSAYAQESLYEDSAAVVEESLEAAVDSMAVAVDSTENYNFHFVYIDHEPTTPIGELCRRISKLHNDAVETGDKVIIYLANEDQPIISFTNLKDPVDGLHRDSVGFFDFLIDELQSINYHEVYSTDLDTIKAFIGIDGKFPLFDEKSDDRQMNYKSVAIDFYIGKRFWALHYNENVIAQLFESLRIPYYMKKYPVSQLSFNVFKPENDLLIYPEGQPFGLHDLGGINKTINIIEY